MPSLKKRYEIGEAIEYDSSFPLEQWNIIPDGYMLDQIYIVKLPAKVPGKAKITKPVAVVREAISPDTLFDYGERIPSGHQIVQALKNVRNSNLTFRLLTGIGSVYGRIVFTNESKTYIYTRHVRSRKQFEAYMKATDIINANSPGPYRLVSKEEDEENTIYTFQKLDGSMRQIQYIREQTDSSRIRN